MIKPVRLNKNQALEHKSGQCWRLSRMCVCVSACQFLFLSLSPAHFIDFSMATSSYEVTYWSFRLNSSHSCRLSLFLHLACPDSAISISLSSSFSDWLASLFLTSIHCNVLQSVVVCSWSLKVHCTSVFSGKIGLLGGLFAFVWNVCV